MARSFLLAIAALVPVGSACTLEHAAHPRDGGADRAERVDRIEPPCGPGAPVCDDGQCAGPDQPRHCGECGHDCTLLPGVAPVLVQCHDGQCALAGACLPGRADCDGDPANGCETDIRVDARHCGACGNACPSRVNATPTCAAGTCGLACSAGFHDCGGVCVSNAAPATCGTRCTPCPAPANGTAICDGTACGVTCNTGYVPAAGQCVPARCNNRVLDPGEGCDDGNNADGDGCSASCQLEANTVNRACGGAPTVIPIRRGVQWYVGDTSSAGDDVSGCGSNGPDQVWRFDLTTAGTLVVTVQPNGWDAVVNSGLVTCSDPGACLDGAGNGRAETRSIYLLPGRFWLVVDGTGMRNSGTYTLRVELM